MNSTAAVVTVAVAMAVCAAAGAQDTGKSLVRTWADEIEMGGADAPARLAMRPLSFDLQPETSTTDDAIVDEALKDIQQEQAADESPEGALREGRTGFGRAGAQYWTFGAGVAHNFHEDMDYNLHVTWSRFIADELEFAVEGGAWYFAQDGEDTVGLNGNLILRWHFLHPECVPENVDWDWSVYSDVGMGLMGSFDNVPATGTGFTFTPRAGFGMTKLLDDDGTRLQLGLRWHHISNGRIEGDVRNPSRDSIMLYAAVMIPF